MKIRKLSPDKLAVAANQNKKEEVFWLNKLSGELVKSRFPFDYKKGQEQESIPETLDFKFPDKLSARLIELSKGSDYSLNVLLTAGLAVLLCKYGGTGDVMFGMPIYKQEAEKEFINTLLVFRYSLNEHDTFKGILVETGRQVTEAITHYSYPLELLPRKLKLPAAAGEFPFFDIVVLLRNIHDKGYIEHTRPPVIFSLSREGESVAGEIEYDSLLYARSTIARIGRHYVHLFHSALDNLDVPLPLIDILPGEEKKQILYEFNDPEPAFPCDKTIPGLFEKQVSETPDHIALTAWSTGNGEQGQLEVEPGTMLTYRQLNDNAGRLAALLIEKGLCPGDLVALMTKRSIEMIVGILGILKTGCGYVPLNPKAPAARNEFMMAECGVELLLTTRGLQQEVDNLRKPQSEMVFLDALASGGPLFEKSGAKTFDEGVGLEVPSSGGVPEGRGGLGMPGDIAYVIFTSGSTGNPKGVPISHANLSPLLHWGYRDLGIGAKDRAIQNLAYYFDWSVWEIFINLTTGAALYMVPDEVLLNPEVCVDFIDTHGITVLHVTPTQYLYFVNVGRKMTSLSYLFIGAEKLTYDLVERSFASIDEKCRLFNMYGPTEATIISAVLEIYRQDYGRFESLSSVPIGVPSGNTVLLVVDNFMKLCPVGVTGELVIAGGGLAHGYLNNPELTSEKFSTSNFQLANFQLIYKTGDLVRWLADGPPAEGAAKATYGGVIEFLGRIDQQVKIRGFRIELAEIAAQLLKHEAIKDAVVLTKEGEQGSKELWAYIVTRKEFTSIELKNHLSNTLPDYMVPAYFVKLEKIPVTQSGKIDRQALQEHGARVGTGREYAAPASSIEKRITAIWANVLQVDRVSINDNFFEIGGNSLKIIWLNGKLKETFRRDIPVVALFRYPTIHAFARYLAQDEANIRPGGEPDRTGAIARGKKDRIQRRHKRKGVKNES